MTWLDSKITQPEWGQRCLVWNPETQQTSVAYWNGSTFTTQLGLRWWTPELPPPSVDSGNPDKIGYSGTRSVPLTPGVRVMSVVAHIKQNLSKIVTDPVVAAEMSAFLDSPHWAKLDAMSPADGEKRLKATAACLHCMCEYFAQQPGGATPSTTVALTALPKIVSA